MPSEPTLRPDRSKIRQIVKQCFLGKCQDLSGNSAEDIAGIILEEFGSYQLEQETQREELKRAQLEAETAKSRFSILYNHSPVGYLTLDETGVIVEANDIICALLLAEKDVIIGKHFQEFLARESADELYISIRALLAGQIRDKRLVQLAGRPDCWFQTECVLLNLPGLDRQILCTVTDKTESEIAKIALVESETSYRLLMLSVPMGVILQRADGTILNWNRMASDLFELTEAEVLGKSIHNMRWNIFRPDGSAWPVQEFPSVVTLETGKPCRGEIMRLVTSENVTRLLSINTEPLYQDDNTKPCAVIITISDITGEHQAESQLESANQIAANILNSMSAAIIVADGSGCITHFNTKAQDLFNKQFQDVVGLGFLDVLPSLPLNKQQMDAVRSEHKTINLEKILIKTLVGIRIANMKVYPLEASGLDNLVVVIEDVTERVRLEGMMAQTEKLISAGGLAAGMAHEINNPLSGIIQGAQVILRRLDPENQANRLAAAQSGIRFDSLLDYLNRREIMTMLSHMRESAVRAAFIVSSMLEFSRRSDVDRSPEDISTLLDKAVELSSIDYDLKHKFDFRQIEIVKDYDQNLPMVPCSAMEIEQVFLNLLRNAAQAFCEQGKERDHPRIILRTRQEDGMARIEVEDNGPGIPEDIRSRIFEPFFTTKRVGEGTGLGLSVSFSIVTKGHGGTIEVESMPGTGTRFILRLPLLSSTIVE